ncbi:MAG: hypothetical protein HGGPFJEG_03058 [Ignavibacteria bacterium]|nr:hypothetical protein [Ignavibacteria bacterium]
MALGKNNARIRSHMGDNGHLKYGNPGAWSQIGKSNRWSLTYELGDKEAVMADETVVSMQSIRKVTLEIDLAQSHPEEMALIDQLRNSETGIEFWGDAGKIGTEYCEVYIPDLIVTGSTKLETPAGDNIKIQLNLKVNPQSDVFEVQDVDLPTATNHGGTAVESENEFFAYFVVIPD